MWSVWIRGRHLDRLGAQAGQFFNWRFLTRGLFWPPTRGRCRPARVPGACGSRCASSVTTSAKLAGLRPGTRVLVEGPYGAFTTERRQRRRVAPGRGRHRDHAGAGPGRGAVTRTGSRRRATCTLALPRRHPPTSWPWRGELQDAGRRRPGMTLHLLVGPPVHGSWLPRALVRPGGPTPMPSPPSSRTCTCTTSTCAGPAAWMDLVHDSLADGRRPARPDPRRAVHLVRRGSAARGLRRRMRRTRRRPGGSATPRGRRAPVAPTWSRRPPRRPWCRGRPRAAARPPARRRARGHGRPDVVDPASTRRTIDGGAAKTQYGTVQVRVVMTGGNAHRRDRRPPDRQRGRARSRSARTPPRSCGARRSPRSRPGSTR